MALCFALSCSMEFLQIFDKTRVCSLLDVLNNTLGGLIGVVLGARFRRSMSGAGAADLLLARFSALCACSRCWLGSAPGPAFCTRRWRP